MFAAQSAHSGSGEGGGERLALAVEGFDVLGDGEVLVGDDAVWRFLLRRRIFRLSECLASWVRAAGRRLGSLADGRQDPWREQGVVTRGRPVAPQSAED